MSYSGSLFKAIKTLQSLTGCSLVEAKYAMDQYFANNPTAHGLAPSEERSQAQIRVLQRSNSLTTNSPVTCPKCNSTQITMNRRGWKLTTGFRGSSKMLNTCMNCGHKWKPQGSKNAKCKL